MVTACHNDPKPVEPTTTTQPAPQETVVTDPATFTEERPAQPEPEAAKPVEKKKATITHKAVETAKPVAATSSAPSTNSNTAETNTGSTTSASENEAKQKKGWSKTAKGAVIGGVTGAAAGAVINKNNRAAGAVIGGVVGAGAGAIIGNEMDKKDGRH